MGVVYRAEDIRLSREVALKFLPDQLASDPVALERFRREAHAASRINHPHICTVYDVGQDEQGRPFIAMELLEGETLKSRLQSGPVPLAELLEWGGQIADALDAAHNAGVIHRDIKPANLFITTRRQAKILDFGLARSFPVPNRAAAAQTDHRTSTTVALDYETSPGQTTGTILYMSPEQARGEELDPRTDLFSMAIVLYEMATGELPFNGHTSAMIFDAILNREPLSVLERDRALPPELSRIIARSLEKDRRLRHQSAAELRADIERLSRERSSAGQVAGTVSRVGASRHGSRTRLALGGAALLVAVLTGAAFLLRVRPPPTLSELVARRITSNGEDAPIQSIALSPDGKYLVYSDRNGAHLRSMQAANSRVLPGTKAMSVEGWAVDGTQFLLSKPVGEQVTFYKLPVAADVPQPLGETRPSPEGKFAIRELRNHLEITRTKDGKVFTIDRTDASVVGTAWAPHDRDLAVIFGRPTDTGAPITSWIELLNGETGLWTALVSPQPQYIADAAWISERKLVYAKYEPSPRTDTNLWTVDIDPRTGNRLGAERRRTNWADFEIRNLSISMDGSRLCFLRGKYRSNLYVGQLERHPDRLVQLRALTNDDAYTLPIDWTRDSRTVISQSNRDGQFRVYKQDLNSDSPDAITSGPGSQTDPRISPDGQYLIYWESETPEHKTPRLMRAPLAGGSAREVLEGPADAFHCSRTTGGLCLLDAHSVSASTLSLFDPLSGRIAKILHFPSVPEDTTISPDGQHIALVLPGRPHNHIRVTDLDGFVEQDITVADAQDLETLDWSADGNGFLSGDVRSDSTRLLSIGKSGVSHILWMQPRAYEINYRSASQVLWTQPGGYQVWAIPSPDGRYLATYKPTLSANVWMVENP